MSFDYRKKFIGNQINWSVRTGKNENVYSKELFGGNIEANSVPVWTAESSENPYAVLTDPGTGLKIGINGDRLGLGMLVIGTGEEYRSLTYCHNLFAEIIPRGMDGRLVYSTDSDTDILYFL